MTILFLDQYGALAGAQRCLLDLAPGIRAMNWASHAAAPDDGPLLEKLLAEGAGSVTPLRCGPYHSGRKSPADAVRFACQTPRLARAIARLAADCGAGLLYVNGPRLVPAARLAAAGRPLVFHCHSRLRAEHAWLVGRCLAGNATVLAASRFAAAPLERHLRPGRLRVIYSGVAGDPHGPRAETAAQRIGVIGRIAPQKGQHLFVEAVRLLPRTCRSLICGAPLFSPAGYLEGLRKAAASLPIDFLDWQEDVYAVLRNLDLLVVPSLGDEAAPRVILEAFAAGVPVLAFRTGGIPELVEDGHTGFLVDQPAAEALAAGIRTALSAPETLERVRRAALAAWRERFNVQRYRQEIVAAIQGLAQRAPAPDRAAAAGTARRPAPP